jgi:hypothetical protein
MEMRTLAQGTPLTSDRGPMELNKLDLWCLNLEACLWRCLLMVLFIDFFFFF